MDVAPEGHAIQNADELVESTQSFSDSAYHIPDKINSFNSGDTVPLLQSVDHEDLTPRVMTYVSD